MNVLKCKGKVTLVDRSCVTAILFFKKASGDYEVIGELDKFLFPPKTRFYNGMIFTYKVRDYKFRDPEVTCTPVKLKKITAKQLKRLKAQVQSMVPEGEY